MQGLVVGYSIYIRNPLSFNLFSKNRLIDSNLTLAAPILLSFALSIMLLSVNRLTISYSYLTVTNYKSVSAILVSPLVSNIMATINNVVAAAFSSILS